MCEGNNGGSDGCDTQLDSAGGHDLQECNAGEPYEPFMCQICLDIAYKPIVLQACGHAFCFWCIRRSMNEMKPSQCPACRHAYLHFPRVCRLLHFLLEKAWPQHYERKASETLAMEQTNAVFSPRILPLTESTPSASHGFGFNSLGHKIHVYPERPELAMDAAESAMVGVEDVSCVACRKLLYRPVVINCGEAVCEACWKERAVEEVASSNRRCCGCGGLHPAGGPVRVCLALHHYMERAFPSLYSQRRRDTDLLLSTPPTPGDKHERWVADDVVDGGVVEEGEGFVHIGVGCDGCGMFPIVSHNRYHCVDCGDKVGYDLCESCYHMEAAAAAPAANYIEAATPAAVGGGSGTCSTKEEARGKAEEISPVSVGRFNQQHNREQHHLVAVASAQKARPATFGAVLHFLRNQTAPLHLDLPSGTISRRRHTHHLLMDDFDDYIDTLV